jgi:hypothetical protein
MAPELELQKAAWSAEQIFEKLACCSLSKDHL